MENKTIKEKKIRQKDIAKALNMSAGHLSDILNKKQEPGKKIAKRMGRLTNRPWIDFMVMKPKKMLVILKNSIIQIRQEKVQINT